MAAEIQTPTNPCVHVPIVDSATSERFCAECGLVVDEPSRVVEYQMDNPQHATGHGSYPKALLRRKDAQGQFIPYRVSEQFYWASRRGFRGDRQASRAVRQQRERDDIERCMVRLSLCIADKTAATEAYRTVREKGIPMMGYSRETYTGACIFLGLRRAGRPILLSKVCEELGVSRTRMNGMVSRIVRKVPSLSHISTVVEVLAPLRSIVSGPQFAQIAKLAIEWQGLRQMNGHTPRGIAAAATYRVMGPTKNPAFSQVGCGKLIGVTEITVRSVLRRAETVGALGAR